MMIRKICSNKNVRQFVSYLFVGGAATVVEWGLFWILMSLFGMDQNPAFVLAYIVSTLANMLLGRMTTFKNASVLRKGESRAVRAVRETVLIYLVAGVGCLLNILFLNLFTAVFHMSSMLSKILTTVIVFVSNYLAKKLGVYKENPSHAVSG